MVFEPLYGGHRHSWTAHVLASALDIADPITLVTSERARNSDDFRFHIDPILTDRVRIRTESLECFPARGMVGGLRFAMRQWNYLKRAIAQDTPDHVLIPTVGGIFYLAGLLPGAIRRMRVPIEVAIHRGVYPYTKPARVGGLPTILRRRAIRKNPFFRIHSNDLFMYNWLNEHVPAIAHKTHPVPEPVEKPLHASAAEAKRFFGIAPDQKVIGSVGVQDQRKGVDLLVRAFERAHLNGSTRLFLAGQQSDAVRRVVAEIRSRVPGSSILEIDRFLTEEEFINALLAMDVVAVSHHKHIGVSTVLIKAAALERPIVACDYGWIGFVTQTFSLGQSCDVEDPDQFALRIRETLNSSEAYRLGEMARRFVAPNTVESFRACWTDGIRSRLGLPNEDLPSWDWLIKVFAAGDPSGGVYSSH
jgi:glycosyltransferase involved in cell wall biosynthesis